MDIIQDYLIRAKDDHIIPENYTENKHGFITYRVLPDKIIVLNCYGDGNYWDKFITSIAKKNNISKIMFGTKRDYKPFARKYRYTLTGYILEKEV